MRDRWHGAIGAGVFGCVLAGPQQVFTHGIGRDLALAVLVGAATGGAFGFTFPYALRRRRIQRPVPPPPPYPPPPPPEQRT